MSTLNMIRTWIDEALRHTFSNEQHATLLETSARAVELNEVDLNAVAGAGFLFDS